MGNEKAALEFFTLLGNNRPFLKMALEGFAGTGKTFTSVQIAMGLHKYIKSTKPIVCYDTERALKALKPKFEEKGIEIYTRESRSLTDLNKAIDFCANGFSDILIIDSITHVWEALVESYRNEKRRSFIQFQDWGILKPKWKREFSDRLVQSNIHIIFTGRAGYEYDNVINEETNKKELVKTGIKMKVENETEYEPDIVVLMEKIKELEKSSSEGESSMKIKRQATIIKDRTDTIDGQTFIEPTFENFIKPIQILLKGEAKEIIKPETIDTFKTYEDEQHKNKNKKEIMLEEIQGIFIQLFPGVSANEKKAKSDLLENILTTRSWKQVELMPLDVLIVALDDLKIKRDNILSFIKENSKTGNDLNWEELGKIITTKDFVKEQWKAQDEKELEALGEKK
jgi:hypothetical protein